MPGVRSAPHLGVGLTPNLRGNKVRRCRNLCGDGVIIITIGGTGVTQAGVEMAAGVAAGTIGGAIVGITVGAGAEAGGKSLNRYEKDRNFRSFSLNHFGAKDEN